MIGLVTVNVPAVTLVPCFHVESMEKLNFNARYIPVL